MLSNDIITLRAPEPEDLDKFYNWENDTNLWSLGSTVTPFSKYVLKEYIATAGQDIYQTRQMRLMIVQNSTDQVVGMIDLFDFDPFHRRAAMGLLIDPEHQRKHYGTMALELLEEYAFKFLGIHMLYAYVPVANEASLHLFEKKGFVNSGTMKAWIRVATQYEDVAFMQKINE